jgi:hypothetical protein
MKQIMKFSIYIIVITFIAQLALGATPQKQPVMKTVVFPTATCTVEQKSNVLEITCPDGWKGQVIAGGKDLAWFKWTDPGLKKAQFKQIEIVSNGKLNLVPMERRVECLQPRDVCTCNLLSDGPDWCSLPSCCPGTNKCDQDAYAGGFCNDPGVAYFDFCGFVSGGCNDDFTTAAGIKSYFCVGKAIGCD